MNKWMSVLTVLAGASALAACGTENLPSSAEVGFPSTPVVEQVAVDVGVLGGFVASGAQQLSVPFGSLSSLTRITMSTETVDGELVTELLPDGLQFANGCVLRLPVPAGSLPSDEFRIHWWDPAAAQWVDIGGTRVGNDVEVELFHFSKYRMVEHSG